MNTPPSVVGRSSAQLVDSFNTSPPSSKSSHRYSNFDARSFSPYTGGSPTQAKRAIEAQLIDTDRRIREASRLGTGLLEQKQQLKDRLKDVEKQQGDTELDPELKQKLKDLEHGYNELGRDTARALVSKTRYSGQNGNKIHIDDEQAVDARASPTRPAAPAQSSPRKQRNTSSAKVDNLAFATEISTSLLGQVRHLQNVLAEKEEALRMAHDDNAKRDADERHTHSKLKTLDENEQRYKDENWHLETQVQDLAFQLKEAITRENKAGNALNAIHVGKATTERELDDLRLHHNRLADDHAILRKQHDTETAALRRNITLTEGERDALHEKMLDMTTQNEELARAMAFRMRNDDAAQHDETPFATTELPDDNFSLDPSPPASPTKGTPRHGALESETLKSSLHHAHRMIQNLKNNIHREKTEKLELRRLLQETRDELEMRRADGGITGLAGRKRKPISQTEFKKPARPAQLGIRQGPFEEIINDPSWEEFDDSPSRSSNRALGSLDFSTDASDAFETANEADSTDAFETAESVVGEDTGGDETETEGSALKARTSKLGQMRARKRSSYLSTASSDGEDMFDLNTPQHNDLSHYKSRSIRSGMRVSSQSSNFKDSPASFTSDTSQVTATNLAAELEDIDHSSLVESTPSRSIRSMASNASSPEELGRRVTVVRSPMSLSAVKPVMVDSATLTDPWQPEIPSSVASASTVAAGALSGVAASVAAVLGFSRTDESAASEQAQNDLDAASMTGVASADQPTSVHSQADAEGSIASEFPQSSPRSLVPSSEATGSNAAVDQASSKPWSFSNVTVQSMMPVATEPRVPIEDRESTLWQTSPASLPSADTAATQLPKMVRLEVSPIHVQSIIPTPSAPLRDAGLLSSNASVSDDRGASSVSAVLNGPFSMTAVQAIIRGSVQSNEGDSDDIGHMAGRETALLATPRASQINAHNDAFSDFDSRVPTELVASKAEYTTTKAESPDWSSSGLAANAVEEKRAPFQQVSGNIIPQLPWSATTAGKAEDSPIMSVAAIEALVRDRDQPTLPAVDMTIGSRPRPSRSNSRTRTTAEPLPPPDFALPQAPKRTASPSNIRKGTISPPPPMGLPPLPADHRQVIAAASRTSSLIGSGPPAMIAPMASRPSTSQQHRPRAPSDTLVRQPNDTRFGSFTSGSQPLQRAEIASDPVVNGRSSMSSFASEIDERFAAVRPTYPHQPDDGFDMGTDPRLIQAITQTMIGEFMWKYTRKAGRGEHSENRHRRFFWIHPYTRTLYWSTQDPSHSGRVELKAKSVPIEAVKVVSDDNPLPPGLHAKSIVIITPGRSIKFTAPTSHRHETWFNALSYLLLRSNPERAGDAAEQAAQYQSMRSGRGTASLRGTSSVRGRMMNAYSSASHSSQPISNRDRTNNLEALTSEEVSEFNPTLHPSPAKSSSASRNGRTGQSRDRAAEQHPERVASLPLAGRQQNVLTPSRSLSTRQSAAVVSATGTTGDSNASYMHTPTSSTASSGADAAAFDADGFRRPARPTTRVPTTRLSSLSLRSRAAVGSMFGRSKSQHRAAADEVAAPSAYTTTALPTGCVPAVSRSGGTTVRPSLDSMGSVVTGTTAVPNSGDFGTRPAVTVENVRACCDGRHDVGDLSHRSRHGSLGGRHGHVHH